MKNYRPLSFLILIGSILLHSCANHKRILNSSASVNSTKCEDNTALLKNLKFNSNIVCSVDSQVKESNTLFLAHSDIIAKKPIKLNTNHHFVWKAENRSRVKKPSPITSYKTTNEIDSRSEKENTLNKGFSTLHFCFGACITSSIILSIFIFKNKS